MKFIKMLGLMAVAAAALMAFAGTASATTVTSNGATYAGTIHAVNENGHVSLHGSNGVTIECASTVHAANIDSQGEGITAEGNIDTLIFNNCTNGVIVHVRENGSLIAHTSGTSDAALTSSGARVEVTANSIFGTITCIYTTNATSLGTLTGSATTGGKATLDINATIPRTGGSALCGSSGNWTGNYVVNSPTNLNVH